MKRANWKDKNIAAIEYDIRIHGEDIFCQCGARVICVTPNNDEREPFFKTTGRGDSQHKPGCGETRNLHINHIEKAIKYMDTIGPVSEQELAVIALDLGKRVKMTKRDVNTSGGDSFASKPNYVNKPKHIESKLHHSIKTLKKVASIIKKNEPEELSKIAFKLNGKIIRFFDLVVNQNIAYEKASINEVGNQDYIVYGKVQNIIKKDKVMFINLDEQERAKSFALVIFSNKFDQFAFVNKTMEGKFILAFGNVKLKKSGYDGAQMILNDKKYLEFLPD